MIYSNIWIIRGFVKHIFYALATILLLCQQSSANEWKFKGPLPQGSKTYCQTISPEGLGVQLFDDGMFIIALLNVNLTDSSFGKNIILNDTKRAGIYTESYSGSYIFEIFEIRMQSGKSIGIIGYDSVDPRFLKTLQTDNSIWIKFIDDIKLISEARDLQPDIKLSLAGSSQAIHRLLTCF